jgi:hypothetical protein
MRDRETIDSELRLLVAVRWSIREHGGEPSSRQVDELLDERLAHRGRAGEDAAVDAQRAPGPMRGTTRSRADRTCTIEIASPGLAPR